MRAFAVLLLVACCGCATVDGGWGVAGRAPATTAGLATLSAPAPDSATLTFHAPTYGHGTCAQPDTTRTLRDAVWCEVWRINDVQPPGYYRGCEFDTTCWRGVVLFNEPRVVWAAWRAPGDACAVRVPRPGQYVAHVRGQLCGSWRVVVVP